MDEAASLHRKGEMRHKKICITAADITDGERRSYDACPIARAVRRAWRARFSVVVRHEVIAVGGLEDSRLWIAIPSRRLSQFMKRFDDGKTVKPMEESVEFR